MNKDLAHPRRKETGGNHDFNLDLWNKITAFGAAIKLGRLFLMAESP